MPSSRPNVIPSVIHVIRQLAPTSILDVGVGFGKWGHLFREYTDIVASENDPSRYRRENWQVRIEGVEGYEPYLTPAHEYFYDRIHIGDAREVLPGLGSYDVIFFGDIIEHFHKPDGVALVQLALGKAERAVMLTTPRFDTGQEDSCANELEIHRSLWTIEDFRALGRAEVAVVDDATLVAVLMKEGVPTPVIGPPRDGAPASALRRALARAGRRALGAERWERVREIARKARNRRTLR